ncbi:outer membrane protein transport protein [Shewanella algae]|uniref:Outer membrane protein transport protein n=2 Tax=Unclassified Bacteria TaxID=49928 RepID=A0AAU6VPX3_UNCXX|nr:MULTISPECIES: outer membrane protein transport protein [Shewanella]MCT8981255.1 outer membrane protein transport protein [Shewanella algae]MDE0568239.1 outer membrane protein transport protein [Shewanella sp. K8]
MKKQLIAVAIAASFVGATTQVQAAGFQLAESSATGLGRAFAGEAAMADNPAAQGRNPAMLSYLEGRQISAGAIYVMPDVDATGRVSLTSLSDKLPFSVTMNADALDVADNAAVPNFYYSNQLNDSWTWGLALNSNYGLSTELPAAHAASIFGNKTAVTTVELNTNIAYRIDEHFTVGAGLRGVYGDGEIGASVPGWIEGVRAIPGLPAEVTSRLPAAGTELKHLEGDDFGYGWQLGASWQINANHRLGIAYHSHVELDLDGQARGLVYTGGTAEVEGYLPLELPAFAELASYHQLTDNWAMHASINWTDWSVFNKLVAYFPGEQKPIGGLESDLVKEENFKDNWRFALGTSYQLNNEWLLRAGVALDKTAVDDEYRTITIPDTDRLWFSVGAGYAPSKNLTVDLGLTYIRAHGDAPINETQDLMGLAKVAFQGDASGHVWLAGLQVTYKM